jgi:hypothetical protein
MKKALTFIYFIFGSFAFAGEPVEKTLASIKRGDATFSYVRTDREDRSEWELRHAPRGDVLLRFSTEKADAKKSIYTYSNLIDVIKENDQAGILLSLDVGLLYVRCTQKDDGSWTETWRQRIIGATGPQAKITVIQLKAIDTITIKSSERNHSEFVLSQQEVKKDGVAYVPTKGVSIGGGSSKIEEQNKAQQGNR